MAEASIDSQLRKLCIKASLGLHRGQTFGIGGRYVLVSSNSKPALESLETLLSHLIVDGKEEFELWYFETQEELKIPDLGAADYSSEEFSAFLDHHSGLVVIEDLASQRVVALGRSNPFSFDRPDKARLILQTVSPKHLFPVHGGTLSWPGSEGLLLSASGGSGKSTAVAAAILSGAETTGDDFQLAEHESSQSEFACWSMFRSVRLEVTGLSQDLLGKSVFPTFEGKRIHDISTHSRNSMRPRLLIGKIVVPRFSEENFSRTLGKMQAVKALAPSSVGLARDREQTLKRIMQLVDRVPTFEVGLTRNLQANADYLRELSHS